MEATAAAAAAGVDLCSQPNRLALCLGAEKLTALTCKQTSQHLSLLSHVSIKGNAYSSCLPVRTHQWAAAAASISKRGLSETLLPKHHYYQVWKVVQLQLLG